MNRKRPRFLHQEHWKLKRFKKAPWRKPAGKRSKMRTKEKAKPFLVNIGYRGPRKVRGWHPKGLPEVTVHNVQDVELVSRLHHQPEQGGERKKSAPSRKKVQSKERNPSVVLRIASSVGTRKKIDIMKAVLEKNMYVTNPRIDRVIITSTEDLESLLPLRNYISAWKISEKLSEEDREDLEKEVENAGLEVMA
jgi:large subunit ribosomal protein L32e